MKIILTIFFIFFTYNQSWSSGWYSTLQGTASDVEQDIPSDGVILQWSSFYQKWLFAYGVAPSGGTTGQVLTKNSGSNYDYSWTTPSGGGGSSPAGANGDAQCKSGSSLAACHINDDGTNVNVTENMVLVPVIGSELSPSLTTPNWTLGLNWSYGTSPNRIIKSAGSVQSASPATPLSISVGVTYQVIITVSAVSGIFYYDLGGVRGQPLASATTYTNIFTATTTDNLSFSTSDGYATMTVSGVSIKPVSLGLITANHITTNELLTDQVDFKSTTGATSYIKNDVKTNALDINSSLPLSFVGNLGAGHQAGILVGSSDGSIVSTAYRDVFFYSFGVGNVQLTSNNGNTYMSASKNFGMNSSSYAIGLSGDQTNRTCIGDIGGSSNGSLGCQNDDTQAFEETGDITAGGNVTAKNVSPIKYMSVFGDLRGAYQTSADWLILPTYANPGITITEIWVNCSSSPTTQLAGTIRYSDAPGNFPGTTPTTIATVNTTAGKYDSGVISTAVASGKPIYLEMTADPTDYNTTYNIIIKYHVT